MKRKILTGLSALAVVAMAGLAQAADLPRRGPAPVYKAPVVHAYNWTGLYAGINVGGGWGRPEFTGTAPSGSFSSSGAVVGGQIGYNWQVNQAVFGLETDIDYTNIRGSAACGGVACDIRNTYFGTVRGRLGYAFDRVLPYVTGGLAYGNIKAGAAGFPGGSESRAGWTLGTGVEFAVTGPWTAKVEYLYADLGKYSCGLACAAAAPEDAKFRANIVRAGLNYRF